MFQIFEFSRQKWDQKINSSDLEKMNVTSIMILLQKWEIFKSLSNNVPAVQDLKLLEKSSRKLIFTADAIHVVSGMEGRMKWNFLLR